MCLSLLAPGGAPEAQRIEEHELKAAFLYNFTKFVEWPPEGFPATDAAFRMCVVGDEGVADFLEALVARESTKGRPIEVTRHRRLRDARPCQILFLAAEAEDRGLSGLGDAADTAVLTVGESDAFLAAGGLVRLRLRGGRVRIEVNAPVRERSPLKLSSKLLQLSDLVRPAAERER